MPVATHRSQRGDASYRVVLWMVMVPMVVAMVAVVVSTARRSGVAVALAYALGLVAVVGGWAVLWDRIDRRRAARPLPPFVWARPQRHELLGVELASGARVLFDGVELAADPSAPGPDVDAVLEAWRLARPDRLPPVLAEAARARWGSLNLGLSGKRLDEWLDGIGRLQGWLEEDTEGLGVEEILLESAITPWAREGAWWSCLHEVPTPEAMGDLLEAGVRDGDDGVRWRRALGRRPRPQDIRERMAAGWSDGHDAECWAKAFGRFPDRSECGPLLAAGIEGWQAEQWARATDAPPNLETILELQRAGVDKSFHALSWSEVVGTPLSPALLRPWQEAGVTSGADAVNWRWALGETVSPVAIRQLRNVGVQDGADASCWRRALGEVPTPERVADLIARGMRTGRQAERRLAKESTGRS